MRGIRLRPPGSPGSEPFPGGAALGGNRCLARPGPSGEADRAAGLAVQSGGDLRAGLQRQRPAVAEQPRVDRVGRRGPGGAPGTENDARAAPVSACAAPFASPGRGGHPARGGQFDPRWEQAGAASLAVPTTSAASSPDWAPTVLPGREPQAGAQARRHLDLSTYLHGQPGREVQRVVDAGGEGSPVRRAAAEPGGQALQALPVQRRYRLLRAGGAALAGARARWRVQRPGGRPGPVGATRAGRLVVGARARPGDVPSSEGSCSVILRLSLARRGRPSGPK